MASSWKKVRLNQLFADNFMAMLATAALFLMFGAQGSLAQTGRANITGTVMDSQGAVVAGATVTATNTATGVAAPAMTNGSGIYSIIQVRPGPYAIKVEKEGFGAQQKENVTLTAEQNLGLDFVLKPGNVSETVTVAAGAELVNTETAELSQTIGEHNINELPLNGRNPASLVLLTPGTVDLFQTSAGGAQQYTTFPTETAASANGGRQGSTLYLLDGAFNQDNYLNAAAPFPNPDATEEFTVIGNNFDPRYGFANGGVVSIVTKSGTNNWHGDVFEFYRNGGFNAKDYFTRRTDEVHRNQFGGSLGGPIIKNRLFVFGNYQGTRQSIFHSSSTGYMWTPAMINTGDFSAYCQTGFANGLCNDRNPNPANPSDPLVTDQIWVANPQGYPGTGVPLSQVVNQPADTSGVGGKYYPGNIVNPATFSAPAVALAKAIAGNLTPLNQYGSLLGAGYPSLTKYNEYTVRGDYNINDHNRVSARMFDNFFTQPPVGLGNAVSTDRSWLVNWQSYAGTWTWTINPHMVNNATVSYTRMYDTSNSGIKVNGKGICFSQYISVNDPSNTPCSIEALGINGGYQSAGGFPGNWQNFNAVNRWTGGFSDNLSITKGKHLIVAGVDFLRQYWWESSDWLALPVAGFGGGPNGQFTGNGFSDFLLGDLSSYEQGGGLSGGDNSKQIAPYVADQIKLTPTLTLSAGLRWEPLIAPVQIGGRALYWSPGHQSTRYPNAPLGIVYPGDPGVPSAGMPSDYKRFFDPRLGLAWAPKALPNTSVRAAFGMYTTPLTMGSWTFGASGEQAPFDPIYAFHTTQIVNGSPIPIIPFAAPWSVYAPTGNTSPFPPFSTNDEVPPSSATFVTPMSVLTAFDLHFTQGRTYTWNTSIEHQFGATWLAKAAFVGSESDHQDYIADANLGLPVCGPVSSTCAAVASNPRANPLFNNISVDYSGGTASYESGQFTLDHRFAHGLQFQANYTYSHNIDFQSESIFGGALDNQGCVRCNRGNSDIDTPQVFVANFLYETPALAGWSNGAKLALGGWQISGIYRAQSGRAFGIYCGCVSSWQDAGSDWANYAPGITHAHVNPGNLTHYLVASDFVDPPQGNSGDTGRNPTRMFGPGVNTWDLGLSKNFRFTERYRFQLRWEMFNAFNRVTFSNPHHFLSSSSFGLINSTNGGYPSRVMQLAGKFYF